MILGAGTDIVSTARVARILARHGEAFERRLLIAEERGALPAGPERAAAVAEVFAAKEAVLKSLGFGLFAFPLTEIRIGRDGEGMMFVRMEGGIGEASARRQVREILIDAASSGLWAAAFAVAQGGRD